MNRQKSDRQRVPASRRQQEAPGIAEEPPPALAALLENTRRHPWPKPAGILVVQPDDELALALEEALEAADFNVETVALFDDAQALAGCRFEMVVLPSRAEPGDYAGLLACLAGSPGAIRLPVSFEASADTAVSGQSLAGFLDSLKAAIEERKHLACSA